METIFVLIVVVIGVLYLLANRRPKGTAIPSNRELMWLEQQHPGFADARRQYENGETIHQSRRAHAHNFIGAQATMDTVRQVETMQNSGLIDAGTANALRSRHNNANDVVEQVRFDEVRPYVMRSILDTKEPESQKSFWDTRSEEEKGSAWLIGGFIIVAVIIALAFTSCTSTLADAISASPSPSSRTYATAAANPIQTSTHLGSEFLGPVTQVGATKSDTSYTVLWDSRTPGWIEATGLPDGNWNVTISGAYHWDSTISEPAGPQGAGWTPSRTGRPDQFPMPDAPIIGVLGRMGNTVHFAGTNWSFSKNGENPMFALNERWVNGAWDDQSGTITITFSPA